MAKFEKPKRAAAPRGDYNDPYKRAARPARPARGDSYAPRPRSEGGFAARPRPTGDFAPRPRPTGDFAPRPRPTGDFAPRPRRDDEDGAPPRGFTVTLDPDVARVFRGDASVNKALRLVLQLMQVVQGPPPRSFAARTGDERGAPKPPARRAYQGSDEARGFKRKPRFGDE
jgi:hypothetical protein